MRVREPFLAGYKFMDGKTFESKVFVVHCLVPAGSTALDRNAFVVKLQLQIAAYAAIGANDRD